MPRGDRSTRTPEDLTGTEIVVTEKLDGACTALRESRALTRSGDRTAPWLAMARRHHAWKVTEPGMTLYGEDLYGVHSIEYGPVREEMTFRAFALVWDGVFASWDELEELARELDIPTVPEVFRGTAGSLGELGDIISRAHLEPSLLGGEREGVVVRRTHAFAAGEFHRNVMKSVRAGHVQTDRHWSRSWRPCRLLRAGEGG